MEDMKKRLKETTVANKEQIFQNCILTYFGDTPINEIIAAKIRKWQGEMMRSKKNLRILKLCQRKNMI